MTHHGISDSKVGVAGLDNIDIGGGFVLGAEHVDGLEGQHTVVYVGNLEDDGGLYMVTIDGDYDLEDAEVNPLHHELMVTAIKIEDGRAVIAETLSVPEALNTLATATNYIYIVYGEWVTTDNQPTTDDEMIWTIVIEEYGEVTCTSIGYLEDEDDEYLFCLGESDEEHPTHFVLILEVVDHEAHEFRALDPEDNELWERITDLYLLKLGIVMQEDTDIDEC